jgi:DNA-binding HxlR family transcriptional regulator
MSTTNATDPVERVERVMGLIAGKWKPAIIYSLVMDGTLRFSELRRRIPKVSQRMLTQQLRDLERHGLVARVYHPQIPPRVEYSVTKIGRSLHPIFKGVCDWASRNLPEMENALAGQPKSKGPEVRRTGAARPASSRVLKNLR